MIELDKSLTVPIYTRASARRAGLTDVEIERAFSRESLGKTNPFSQSETKRKCHIAVKELLHILEKLNNRG